MGKDGTKDFEFAVLDAINQLIDIMKINIETMRGISEHLAELTQSVETLAQSHGYEFPDDAEA